MEGLCRRVGTNREQAWALAKRTQRLTGIVGGVRLKCALLGVQAPEVIK